MNDGLMDLHLAQAVRSLKNASSNNYSDPRKLTHHKQLDELLSKIVAGNEVLPTHERQNIRRVCLDFLFTSIEYLDDSIFSLFPFEFARCLEIAMNEWLSPDEQNYIITTSLQPGINSYFFRPVLDRFLLINTVYQIEFQYRLVRIGLPRYLRLDFLANVVLYHELGHFIDTHYSISETVLDSIDNSLKSGQFSSDDLQDFERFFPYLFSSGILSGINSGYRPIILSHLREYFADLFAAQYIGNCAGYYLEYLSGPNSSVISPTHPATNNRLRMIQVFLDGEHSYTASLFSETAYRITSFKMSKRFEEIEADDFHLLLPPVIANEQQMHGLMVSAWKVWFETRTNPAPHQNLMSNRVPAGEVYRTLNNLVEKSIGNYLIQQQYHSANVSS